MNAGLSIIIALAAAVSLATCDKAGKTLMSETAPGAPATEAKAPAGPSKAVALAATLQKGHYKLDAAHSTLIFKVSHLGFAEYTGQFTKFDAQMELDPASPAGATLTATVDPASLSIPAPPEGFLDELKGEKWLDARRFPQMTYKSVRVEMTGDDTAKIIGDLTLHGVTKPVELRAKFNGGYVGHVYDPNARIGFSATGKFKRSDFGISFGLPQPGSNMGVFDDVDVVLETEFSGPPMPDSAIPAQ